MSFEVNVNCLMDKEEIEMRKGLVQLVPILSCDLEILRSISLVEFFMPLLFPIPYTVT